ncbi:fructose-6-phosphate aldolase [candidate division KSB1 bacterium]|nr:fructose-6-phosphate aldolase [candidate division KSB1 bacterium]
MEIFIDTANIEQIKEAAKLGVVDGVTTNPTLISRVQGSFTEILNQICKLVDGPISAEVVSLDAENMIKEARNLAKIHQNIVVKIPITKEGLQAVKVLEAEGIRCNVTLVFNSMQALMAAKAGASFVSIFVGRLDDAGHQGTDVVRESVVIFRNYDLKSRIIVASIRSPLHIVEAALAGADIATIPFKIIEQLVAHPLTDIGIERFSADWEKVKTRT